MSIFYKKNLHIFNSVSDIILVMKYFADLHIHSHFSLATSKQLSPEYLELWAYLKGLRVIASGDFTHPGWLKELKTKLIPAEPGLFKLKDKYRIDQPLAYEKFEQKDVRFILSAELSNIYKRDAKTRKVHNIVLSPDFLTAEKIQSALVRSGGNIKSDGRPILGMDCRNLLEICLEATPDIVFIPAHIWTPWFSVLGSKSGFDDPKQCYGDLIDHIHAVETGLSSNAPMNWACSFLDKFTLVANSDAHSPDKLGRNANIFDTELSYFGIAEALSTGDPKLCGGTVHLFPQEGKYYNDGHRKCGICWDPYETLKHKGLCPVCGKEVVIGVLNRVAELSDRKNVLERPNRLPLYSIIPLNEIIAEIEGVASSSKRVNKAYFNLIHKFGQELNILLDADINQLSSGDYPLLGEAVKRMRARQVIIKAGCDGEYGRIKVFKDGEIDKYRNHSHLFEISKEESSIDVQPLLSFDLNEYQKERVKDDCPENDCPKSDGSTGAEPLCTVSNADKHLIGLNHLQIDAVKHYEGPCLVLAGPGTGKTKTLTARITELILNRQIKANNILAITFTNKAALEIKLRIKKCFSNQDLIGFNILTFHGLGLTILKEFFNKFGRKKDFYIIDEKDKQHILQRYLNIPAKSLADISEKIFNYKTGRSDTPNENVIAEYERVMRKFNLFDFEDLITSPLLLLKNNNEARVQLQNQIKFLLIDEYQDIDLNQYQLMRLLMPNDDSNIYAIGDPNQSIYGFRGSDVRFLNEFMKDYPSAKIVRLRNSYRCSDKILKASAGIVCQIAGEPGLNAVDDGVHVRIAANPTEKSEAEYVARTIENMLGGLRFFSMDSDITSGDAFIGINSFTDFAVLCRTRALMAPIEKAFHDHAIPYRTYSNKKFFDEWPLSGVIDIMKILRDPTNEYIKDRLRDKKILDQAFKFASQYSNSIRTPSLVNLIFNLIKYECNEEINKDHFEKLLHIADKFPEDIAGFIDFCSLSNDTDTFYENTEHVKIMTIHAAKGLEFECVFIIGCEDGIMPFKMVNKTTDYDEERRMLYVGMTRSKKYLFLTHADKRTKFGQMHHCSISPFLKDIQKDLIKKEKQIINVKKDSEHDQFKLF